jgi:hypothetical protein
LLLPRHAGGRLDRTGQFLEHRYFLVVCNRLDSLDRSQTTMVLFRGMMWRPASDLDPEELPPGTDRSATPKMVFNAAQIGSAHLWFDKHLIAGFTFRMPWLKPFGSRLDCG